MESLMSTAFMTSASQSLLDSQANMCYIICLCPPIIFQVPLLLIIIL